MLLPMPLQKEEDLLATMSSYVLHIISIPGIAQKTDLAIINQLLIDSSQDLLL